ncbi:hypothetical protein L218DRAFT_1008555 [Marasmius fiardii PR-910]|nr:hypothetical protein L218DRAFT_1008555 [Marasmius fiardii PR-910]
MPGPGSPWGPAAAREVHNISSITSGYRIISPRLPDNPSPVEDMPYAELFPSYDPGTQRRLPGVILIVRDSIQTIANMFGLWREYQHRPSYDPDSSVPLEELSTQHRFQAHSVPMEESSQANDNGENHGPPWPYQTMSVFNLMRWFNTGSTSKTQAECNPLVREVILDLIRRILAWSERLNDWTTQREARQ